MWPAWVGRAWGTVALRGCDTCLDRGACLGEGQMGVWVRTVGVPGLPCWRGYRGFELPATAPSVFRGLAPSCPHLTHCMSAWTRGSPTTIRTLAQDHPPPPVLGGPVPSLTVSPACSSFETVLLSWLTTRGSASWAWRCASSCPATMGCPRRRCWAGGVGGRPRGRW